MSAPAVAGEESKRPVAPRERGGAAFLVAAGILLSRLAGLVRESLTAHYFGVETIAADAWRAAFRIPNLLQNLFGEGALSASFIPVYAGLLARGERDEARRVAGAVAAILGLITSLFVLVGVLFTPVFVDLLVPGFEGARRELAIRLVRILFPGAGLLVLTAWCLGILNSHRRFFLSYAAPVAWNVVMIATLLWFGGRVGETDLAVAFAWASVAGSGLQFAVQLPSVLRLLGGLRLSLGRASRAVRTVILNFVPVFVSRGVVQVSAYVDQILASWLPTGAVAALGMAQILYVLPVSLFGMSVSAAELPAMSSAVGSRDETAAYLRRRLDGGLRQIAFFIVPTVAGFLAFGDVIVGVLFQSGRFTRADSVYVWGILAGSSVGMLASTLGRLYSSAYYALRDTRTPLWYALLRVSLTTILGYLFAFRLPPLLGIAPRWGAAGLTVSAGLAGWVEFSLLRRTMNGRIGRTGVSRLLLARLWGSALAGVAIGEGARIVVGHHNRYVAGVVILGAYGLTYLAMTAALGVDQLDALLRRVGLRRRA